MISIVSAVIENANPNKVLITFDKELDKISIPDLSAFTLAGKTISSAENVLNTLTLTVTVPYEFGDTPSLNYIRPEINPLKIPHYLPNKLTGAIDKLKVSSNNVSTVYQTPNTQEYIDSDVDLLWFDMFLRRRSVTKEDLIGSDFSKTWILYDDSAPNTLREIIIPKSNAVFTEAEMNYIRDYCRLSVWWDNTLSDYGKIKSNRDTWKQEWIYNIIEDGNTFGFYQARDKSTITLDLFGKVISVISSAKNNVALINYFGTANCPLPGDDGIIFNGTGALRMGCGSKSQPMTFYLVLSLTSWSIYKYIFWDVTNTFFLCKTYATESKIGVTANGWWVTSSDLGLNQFRIVRIIYNGADNSVMQVDEDGYTSNIPAGLDGLVDHLIFGHNIDGAPLKLAGMILREGVDTTEKQKIIYDYLKNLYSL